MAALNENATQRYPFDSSSFERIRKEGYIYVDKTAYIHSLISEGQFFFLARPRRFGKSLFLSTLEQYFLGNRELFKGLEIDRLQPDEWAAYPILHIDFTGTQYDDESSLDRFLEGVIESWCEQYDIKSNSYSYSEKFYDIIRTLSQRLAKKVVVLIDEYDNPLTKTIDQPELQDRYRDKLQAFYSVLKKSDKYLKFCLLTGVSRYGKVSIFSGLNNLKDITFSDRYAGICGITYDELRKYYHEGILRLAKSENINEDEAYSLIKDNYDGYHFSKCMLDVYNPFSINNVLTDLEIKDYWCQSGSPELLSRSLLHVDYDLESIAGTEVSETALSNLSLYAINPIPLFYQTGYLTLKSYNKEDNLYTVGYPNKEVENGLLSNVLDVYAPTANDVVALISKLRKCLNDGDSEGYVKNMKAFLSGIPSNLKRNVGKYENYYHTIFYCVASLLGLKSEVEHNTAEGFIDMLVTTQRFIYIIEFKVNGTAESAIQQIDERNYASKFAQDSRKLIKIGIGFSKKTGTINSYIIN